MMDVDYFGTVNMVKAFLPHMLERGDGYIVNISSAAGFLAPLAIRPIPLPNTRVRGFSDVLRLELKPLGVRVSVAFPPDMDTLGMVNEIRPNPLRRPRPSAAPSFQPGRWRRLFLNGIKRGQYIILPGFETKLYYYLVFLLGNANLSSPGWVACPGASEKK